MRVTKRQLLKFAKTTSEIHYTSRIGTTEDLWLNLDFLDDKVVLDKNKLRSKAQQELDKTEGCGTCYTCKEALAVWRFIKEELLKELNRRGPLSE